MVHLYKNGQRLAWALNLIRFNALLAVIDFPIQFYGLWAAGRASVDGSGFSGLNAYDAVSPVVGRVQLVALFLAGFAFLLWWHRSVVNLGRAGQGLSFTPGWAVGMWFVPILTFYLPYQAVKEAATTRAGVRPPNLALWWGAWVTGTVSTNVAGRLSGSAETLAQVQTATMLYALSDAVTVLAALLVLPIMRFIQERQDHLARS